MSRGSKYNIEQSRIVFYEPFLSEQDVRINNGTPTGTVLFINGRIELSTDGKITYSGVRRGVKTVRIVLNLDSTTEDIIQLTSSHSITVSGGTISATGFSAPTIYVNGTATSTITATKSEIVITTDTAIDVDDLVIGYVSGYLEGKLELVSFYNYSFIAAEISNLYEGKRFRDINVESQEKLGTQLNSSALENSSYTTFSAVGTDGFDATTDGAGTDVAGTADEIVLVNGTRYRVTFDLTLNSGSRPDQCAFATSLDSTLWSNRVSPYVGANSMILTANNTGTGVFQIYNTATVGDFEIRNLSIKEITLDGIQELLNVSGQLGSIVSRYNRTIADSGHSIYKDGEVNTLFFSSGTGGIDITPAGDIEPEIFTILLWTKRVGNAGTTTQNREIVGSSSGSSYGWGIAHFELGLPGKFWFAIDDDGTGAWDHYVEPDNDLVENKWYFIACTFDGVNMEMYIDDVQQSGGMACSDVYYRVSHDPITIGKYRDGGSRYRGGINDVRIYEGVLSRAKLSQAFSSERGKYGI